MTLRDLLLEWHQYQPELCYFQPDGSTQIVYDGYIAEFKANEIDGECGFSRAQAMVFAGVCSAIEDQYWDGRLYIEGHQDFQYAIRAQIGERGEPSYSALIVWANPPYGEHQISYAATGDLRGSTLLVGWLKFLRHAAELRSWAKPI